MERITFSAMWSKKLGQAIKRRQTTPYEITIGAAGDMFEPLKRAVNQGIDSHLEAVRFKQEGRTFWIEPESLPTLVRRLLDDMSEDEDSGHSMACGICETLNIELI